MPAPDSTQLDQLTRALGSIAPSWRGRAEASLPVQSTGFASLDDLLPGGGWPLGALTELLPAADGIGEVSLTLPALRQLCQAQRRVILLDPPFTPAAPALHALGVPLRQVLWIASRSGEEQTWVAAQLLREPATGAVLLWSAQGPDRGLRKLQLAAETGGSLAFLFRSLDQRDAPSPAALRLELHPVRQALEARLRKGRGGRPGSVLITLPRTGGALPPPLQ